MTTSKTFEDYPGSESGDNREGAPANYGGRTPFSPIAEEGEEDGSEELLRRQGVVESVTDGVARVTTPSFKHSSVSPSSSSGPSPPRSPLISYPTPSPSSQPPPPPSSQPPPLPPGPIRGGHNHHQVGANSGSKMKQGKVSQRQTGDKKGYEIYQYSQNTNHTADPSTYSSNVSSKLHPQQQQQHVLHHASSHSTGYNQNQIGDKSYSIPAACQKAGHEAEIIGSSKVVQSKQFPLLGVSEHVNVQGGMADLSRGEHVMSGDHGARECPTGASSPNRTSNDMVVTGARTHPHYDPLVGSSGDARLGGQTRHNYPLPPGGDPLESRNDTNLPKSYRSHPAPSMEVEGSVVSIRAHLTTGGKSPNPQMPSKKPGGTGPGGTGQTSPKMNGHTSDSSGAGGRNSPDLVFGSVRPLSNDSGYGHSASSSAHSLASNRTPTSDKEQSTSEGSDRVPSGGVSPTSSTEELVKIHNGTYASSEVTDGATPTNPIVMPEPTKSTKPHPTHQPDHAHNYILMTGPGNYATNQQTSHIVPPIVYPSTKQPQSYAPPTSPSSSHQHPQNISQPGPSQMMPSQPLPSTAQGSHTYYPTHQNVIGTARDGGGGGGPSQYNSYVRPKMAYENVPLAYDNIQSSSRHVHMAHPHPAQHPKYVGVATQGGVAPLGQMPGYQQGGGGSVDPRDRSHDMRDRSHDTHHHGITGGGGSMEYPQMARPPYNMGAGPRRKTISPASLSVAHDAAANGDIATLHHMLSTHEIDAFTFNEHKFTLAHKAALHGQVGVLNFLVSDAGLPVTALQLPDDSFSTPAMLAIQGGHVECLQWMVEEYKVPLEVHDTGGETLMHHAAYHGQVKCLDWLLKMLKKRDEQHKELLDECGVSPAHFSAQGGHLDCLQLLIDMNYSVVHADKEGQKPLDWADHMNQTVCVRYLMMYEACWALSGEVTHLSEQLAIIHKKYDKLQETLTVQNQDHQHAIGILQQNHKERITKMRETYVDLTASVLKNSAPSGTSGSTGGVYVSHMDSINNSMTSTSNKTKSLPPARKSTMDSPIHSKRSPSKPLLPPENSSKKHTVRGVQNHESKTEEPLDVINYRTATPQEVMQEQLSSVVHRMTLRREARKRHGGLAPRNFSPLTPIIHRLYNKPEEEPGKMERPARTQRHSNESHDRRVVPKAVKFSSTVTEFPNYSSYDDEAWSVGVASKPISTHKFSPSHSGSSHSSPSHGQHSTIGHSGSGHSTSGHSTSGHASAGYHNIPDGESGHSKTDSRKSSADK